MEHTLSTIVSLLSVIIEVAAILFAVIEFVKFKRQHYKSQIHELENKILAFYCEEDYMINEIVKLRNDGKSHKTVKVEFRKLAESHPDNKNKIRPKK